MDMRHHNRRGYTLTELLVVLAIIAMLSGVAIPAIAKIGGFMSKKSDAAARELYGELRAARMSAVSYRNDVAVVYAVHVRTDNYSSNDAYIIDGFGMATRATAQQFADITTNTASLSYNAAFAGVDADEVFVLGTEPQARFQKMPNGTAVIGHLTAHEEQQLGADACGNIEGYLDLPPTSVEEFYDGLGDPCGMYQGMTSRGMRLVYLFRVDEGIDALVPVAADIVFPGTVTGGDPAIDDFAFPAHVFRRTGELDASTSNPKERITLAVGPAPDAPLEDRFTQTVEEGGTPIMASPSRVEVYRSTGRVQIGS